jgi:hypothetical protein
MLRSIYQRPERLVISLVYMLPVVQAVLPVIVNRLKDDW